MVISFFLLLFIIFIAAIRRPAPEHFTAIPAEFQLGFTEKSAIPNILWTYWHEPTVPKVVSMCLESWKKHNPTFRIILLHQKNIGTYLPDLESHLLKHNDSHARFSDMVRLNVLAKHGGIWMDASIYCTKSLNWLHAQQQKGKYDFIGYYLQGFTRRSDAPVIESWFLACVPNSRFLNLWKEEFMRLNAFDRVQDYIDEVKRKGVDVQNIPEEMLTYLAIHVACQAVLQKQLSREDRLSLIKVFEAEAGPMKYLAKSEWDTPKSLATLCEHRDGAFLKFRGSERAHLEQHVDLLSCL